MPIQGVQRIRGTRDGDRRGFDGDRRCSAMLIQGVQKIGGTLDGDRHCLDGDRRRSEMIIQGAQKIRGTLDGDRRGLVGVRRESEMLIQGVQRIRETLDGVVELNGSEVEARGRDDGCSHGGWRIRHREPVLSAVCDGNLLLGSTFAYGQHVCIWAARLHLGSTFASGQHVCIWAARLHLGGTFASAASRAGSEPQRCGGSDPRRLSTQHKSRRNAGNRCLRVIRENAFASAAC